MICTLKFAHILVNAILCINCMFVMDNVKIDDMEFLHEFGYLERPKHNEIQSFATVKSAIRNMQKFASLPQTGELDEATKKTMMMPRCANRDVSSDNEHQRIKRSAWKMKNITYKITKASRKLPSHVVQRVLDLSFRAWSRHADIQFTPVSKGPYITEVQFLKGGSPKEGSIKHWPIRVLGHAYFPGGNGHNLAGDLHMNEDMDWREHKPSSSKHTRYVRSLSAVLIHEIGHTLGIDHTPNKDSLMYAYMIKQAYSNYSLPQYDIDTVQKLYGKKRISQERQNWRHNRYNGLATVLPIHRVVNPIYHVNNQNNKNPTRGGSNNRNKHINRNRNNNRNKFPGRNNDRNKPYNRNRYNNNNNNRNNNGHVRPKSRGRINYDQERNERNDLFDRACKDKKIDAIAFVRGRYFIFKEKYFWSLDSKHLTDKLRSMPYLILKYWSALPNTLTRIDSMYETHTGAIMVTSGRKFWMLENNAKLLKNFPYWGKSIRELGVYKPSIDVIFRLESRDETYLISGKNCWLYDDINYKIKTRVDIRIWNGVTWPLKSKFILKKSGSTIPDTYFVDSSGVYYRFNEARMTVGVSCGRLGGSRDRVTQDRRRYVTDVMLKCAPTSANLLDGGREGEDSANSKGSTNYTTTVLTTVVVLALLAIAAYYLLRFHLHSINKKDYVRLSHELEQSFGEKAPMLH